MLQRGSSLQTAAAVQRLTQKASALISGLSEVRLSLTLSLSLTLTLA